EDGALDEQIHGRAERQRQCEKPQRHRSADGAEKGDCEATARRQRQDRHDVDARQGRYGGRRAMIASRNERSSAGVKPYVARVVRMSRMSFAARVAHMRTGPTSL